MDVFGSCVHILFDIRWCTACQRFIHKRTRRHAIAFDAIYAWRQLSSLHSSLLVMSSSREHTLINPRNEATDPWPLTSRAKVPCRPCKTWRATREALLISQKFRTINTPMTTYMIKTFLRFSFFFSFFLFAWLLFFFSGTVFFYTSFFFPRIVFFLAFFLPLVSTLFFLFFLYLFFLFFNSFTFSLFSFIFHFSLIFSLVYDLFSFFCDYFYFFFEHFLLFFFVFHFSFFFFYIFISLFLPVILKSI